MGHNFTGSSSSGGLMGASLADRRRPLSAALQAETPEYVMSHDVSFPPPPPPSDASSHRRRRFYYCCLVIYEFPAASSLLSHSTNLPKITTCHLAGFIYCLFLCNKYFALAPVPLTKLWPAAANCRSKVRLFSAGASGTMLAEIHDGCSEFGC